LPDPAVRFGIPAGPSDRRRLRGASSAAKKRGKVSPAAPRCCLAGPGAETPVAQLEKA
jgi:hypothetical protein